MTAVGFPLNLIGFVVVAVLLQYATKTGKLSAEQLTNRVVVDLGW